MSLEQTYTGLKDKIEIARKEGYSDAEIEAKIQSKIETARAEGYTEAQIRDHIGLKGEMPNQPGPAMLSSHGQAAQREAVAQRAPTLQEQRRVLGIASESDKQARGEVDYLRRNLGSVLKPVPALAAAQIVKGAGGVTRQAGELFGSESLAKTGEKWAGEAETVERQIGEEHPLDPNSWASGVRSGLTSAYMQGPFMAAGAGLVRAGKSGAGLVASLAPLVGITEGEAYQRFRERGHAPGAATAGGVTEGAIEAGTELLPMGDLLRLASPATKQSFGALLKTFTKYGGEEFAGEALATLGQDLTDKVMADPGSTQEDRLRRVEDYFTQINPQTGNTEAFDNFKTTMVATATQTALMGGVGMAAGATRGRGLSAAPPAPEPAAQPEPVAADPARFTNLEAASVSARRLTLPAPAVAVTPEGTAILPEQMNAMVNGRLSRAQGMSREEIVASRRKLAEPLGPQASPVLPATDMPAPGPLSKAADVAAEAVAQEVSSASDVQSFIEQEVVGDGLSEVSQEVGGAAQEVPAVRGEGVAPAPAGKKKPVSRLLAKRQEALAKKAAQAAEAVSVADELPQSSGIPGQLPEFEGAAPGISETALSDGNKAGVPALEETPAEKPVTAGAKPLSIGDRFEHQGIGYQLDEVDGTVWAADVETGEMEQWPSVEAFEAQTGKKIDFGRTAADNTTHREEQTDAQETDVAQTAQDPQAPEDGGRNGGAPTLTEAGAGKPAPAVQASGEEPTVKDSLTDGVPDVSPEEQIRGLAELAGKSPTFEGFYSAVRANAISGERSQFGFHASHPSFAEALQATNPAEAKEALRRIYEGEGKKARKAESERREQAEAAVAVDAITREAERANAEVDHVPDAGKKVGSRPEPAADLRKGDTLTVSEDVEYVRAGVPMRVEDVTKSSIYLVNPETGGRTSVKKAFLQARLKSGVTLEVRKGGAEAPEGGGNSRNGEESGTSERNDKPEAAPEAVFTEAPEAKGEEKREPAGGVGPESEGEDSSQGNASRIERAGAAPSAAGRAKAERIEDFGRVLEGARKHYAEAYRDKMEEALGEDLAAVPLSKSWPEPDYRKLLEEGADPWTVAFVRSARDEVPTKPQKGWKLKGWVEQVGLLRSFAGDVLRGEIGRERLEEALGRPEFKNLKEQLSGRIELYQAVGHEKSLKGIRVAVGRYGIFEGKEYKPPKMLWTVEQKAKATAFSNWPRILGQGETKEAAIADFKAKLGGIDLNEKAEKQVRFGIYSDLRTQKIFIGRKIGRETVRLKEFDTVKEAREYLATNQAELEERLEKLREIPSERRESNSPRVGIDHRSGADVTPEAFMETFAPRGVQFGNYMEGARRQQDLNETFDALMDLAGVLDLPPKALSLNGELGLAFGARGTGGKNAPKAHYEPGTVVINLTKRQGAGSLAHELWHGIDNYFARMAGRRDGYMTESPRGEGVRPQMVEAFKGVREAIGGTQMFKRARRLDAARTKDYWTTMREMSARAFESYVIAKLQDQGASNDYLANIVSKEYWDAAASLGLEKENSYPYPTAEEMPAVRAAFDRFFETVQTRETEQGAALFSVGSRVVEPVSVELLTGENFWRQATEFYRDALQGTEVSNPHLGRISFGKDGRSKLLSVGRQDARRMSVVKVLDALVESATPYEEQGDRKGRPGVSFVKAVAAAEIGGELYAVDLVLKQVGDGVGRFYTLAGYEVKDLDAIDRGDAAEAPLPVRGSSRSRTVTIDQLMEAVKGRPAFDVARVGEDLPMASRTVLLGDSGLGEVSMQPGRPAPFIRSLLERENLEQVGVKGGNVDALREVAKSFGKTLVFFRERGSDAAPGVRRAGDRAAAGDERIAAQAGTGRSEGIINGFVHPGRPDIVYLNAAAPDHLLFVLGHELGHTLRMDDPALWRQMAQELQPLVRNWSAYRSKLSDPRYAALTEEEQAEELFGDVIGHNFLNELFWKEMGEQNLSLFRRVARKAIQLLNKALRLISGQNVPRYIADLKQARAIVAKTLLKYVERAASGVYEKYAAQEDGSYLSGRIDGFALLQKLKEAGISEEMLAKALAGVKLSVEPVQEREADGDYEIRPPGGKPEGIEEAERAFLRDFAPERIIRFFSRFPDRIPGRLKGALSSVLSNPHYESQASEDRRAAYDLNLERSSNANEIKVEIMTRREEDGYEGYDGVVEEYGKANKKEKEMVDFLLVEGDILHEEYSGEDLDSSKNPLGQPVPEVVKRAYLAFRQTINRATEVMFERLGRLRLIPYEESPFYQELIDLLDENLTPKEVAQRFGIHEKAVDAYNKIRHGRATLDAVTMPYKDAPWYWGLRDALIRGMTAVQVQHEFGLTPDLVAAWREIKSKGPLEIATAEQFKGAQWYKTLVDLITVGEEHPMLQKLELYNAYLGVREYDSELAKLKEEWRTLVGYLPRVREDGEWHVKIQEVKESGELVTVWMQPAKTKAGAEDMAEKIEKGGFKEFIPRNFDPKARYRTEVVENPATPEEIHQGIGSHRKIEAIISTVIDKATDAGAIENPLKVQRQVIEVLHNELSARGFARHRIGRSKNLIEGYRTENTPAILAQHIGAEAGWLSKIEFAMRANKLISRITSQGDKVWVSDYVDDALKNATYIDQWLGTLRSLVSFMYLGFKVSSPVLNATQNYVWGQALLSKYTKGSARKLVKAQYDVLRDHMLIKAGKERSLSEEERWALEQGHRRGRTNANYVRAMSGIDDTGGVLGKGQAFIRKITEVSMVPFQAVETYWNREPALLAAFRVFRNEKKMSKEAALKEAERFVDDAHFVVGKENIPGMLRKMGPWGRAIYTFQSFTHNYLLGMLVSLRKGEFEVVMRSMTALVLFGGLAAIPFGDDLDKWYRKFFGERPLRMLEKWLRETAGAYTDLGDQIADFVMHGIPALAGVNFSNSLAVRIPWLSPEDDSMAERVTGVWGGLAKKVHYAGDAAAKGDLYRATEFMSPEALANVLRAYRLYADGATTLSGRPIFGDDGRQVKYTAGEGVIRAFGFMPLEPSKQSQNRWDARRAKEYWSERKADILAQFRIAEDRREAMKLVREFNRELREAPGGVLVPPITPKTLRQALRAKPDKREMAYLN